MAMAIWDGEMEEAVLQAAQRGDRSAQALLFTRYRYRVARQILRMTGHNAAVDDLVQEVFIRAFTALPRFRGESLLGSWLCMIATNTVRNWWDSQRRRQRREDALLGEPADEPESPVEHLEAKEHLGRLRAALDALPDRLRGAFVARTLEGMSLLEASAALGVPVSTVSYQTRRAEKVLRAALGIAVTEH